MSEGKAITRHLVADACEADIKVTITIGAGHTFDRDEARKRIDHLASEAMKVIAAAPGIDCLLARIKVSGR
jgi:dienelactone hydrolase